MNPRSSILTYPPSPDGAHGADARADAFRAMLAALEAQLEHDLMSPAPFAPSVSEEITVMSKPILQPLGTALTADEAMDRNIDQPDLQAARQRDLFTYVSTLNSGTIFFLHGSKSKLFCALILAVLVGTAAIAISPPGATASGSQVAQPAGQRRAEQGAISDDGLGSVAPNAVADDAASAASLKQLSQTASEKTPLAVGDQAQCKEVEVALGLCGARARDPMALEIHRAEATESAP